MSIAYQRAKAKVLRRMRPVILERDKHRCIVCRETERLETAHYLGLASHLKNRIRIRTVDGSKRFRKAEPLSWEELNLENNLVMLCSQCHAIYDFRWWQVPDHNYQQLRAESKRIEGKIHSYLFTLYPHQPIELAFRPELVYFNPNHFTLVGG